MEEFIIAKVAGVGTLRRNWVSRSNMMVLAVVKIAGPVVFGIDDMRYVAIIRVASRHLIRLHAYNAISRLNFGELACSVIAILGDEVRPRTAGRCSRTRARRKRADRKSPRL